MELEEEVKRIVDEVKELNESSSSFISSSSQQSLSLRQKASAVDSFVRRLHSTLVSDKHLDPKLVEKLEEDLHRTRCMLADGETSSFLPSKPQEFSARGLPALNKASLKKLPIKGSTFLLGQSVLMISAHPQLAAATEFINKSHGLK